MKHPCPLCSGKLRRNISCSYNRPPILTKKPVRRADPILNSPILHIIATADIGEVDERIRTRLVNAITKKVMPNRHCTVADFLGLISYSSKYLRGLRHRSKFGKVTISLLETILKRHGIFLS